MEGSKYRKKERGDVWVTSTNPNSFSRASYGRACVTERGRESVSKMP